MLLSLIGEQPIPALLADRAIKPACHLLAHSERTRRVAQNLSKLLPNAELLELPDPYSLESIRLIFEQIYRPGMTFNLTGGTKPMAWAGYEVARARAAQIVYLESEKKQSKLYRINFNLAGIQQTTDFLLGLISLDDYLQAHGLPPIPSKPPVNQQESALHKFLTSKSDELQHNLQYPAFEIDFLVRRGNQVAVIEAKGGKTKRFGIDQLTTITGREYLGTYTGRIWVVAKMPGKQLTALAKAYGIQIVPVQIHHMTANYSELDQQSQQRLNLALDEILGSIPNPLRYQTKNHEDFYSKTPSK